MAVIVAVIITKMAIQNPISFNWMWYFQWLPCGLIWLLIVSPSWILCNCLAFKRWLLNTNWKWLKNIIHVEHLWWFGFWCLGKIAPNRWFLDLAVRLSSDSMQMANISNWISPKLWKIFHFKRIFKQNDWILWGLRMVWI